VWFCVSSTCEEKFAFPSILRGSQPTSVRNPIGYGQKPTYEKMPRNGESEVRVFSTSRKQKKIENLSIKSSQQKDES
jgi:hypothetical protein